MANEKRSDAITNGSQMSLQANAAEIYSGKAYHEEQEAKKTAADFDYDEQLIANDVANTATDRGADFAARERIMGKLKSMGAPNGVISRVSKESLEDVYDKNNDITNIEGKVIRHHAKKTAEYHKDMDNAVRESKEAKKQRAVDAVMAKAEATKDYDAGESLLESKFEKY